MPHPSRAKAIAILGTGSDVGKSMITSGLCRLLYRPRFRDEPRLAALGYDNVRVMSRRS